jgi:spermidine/putrescine transport system permease protein
MAPGTLWLGVFFVIPLFMMLNLALSNQPLYNGPTQFAWNFGNISQAVSAHTTEFIHSLTYAFAATAIDLLIAFPLAYWIVFYGGRWKNFFLLMLLIPFFVSFIIRTLAWQFILADDGIILGPLKNLHLIPQSFHVLATSTAVIAGIAYNFFPFTVLPIYVSLEKIDRRLIEAATDLYASAFTAFLRVVVPLTIPGIFAAFLLTFVPAVGDFVNAQLLGGTNTYVIGQIIQTEFLNNGNYVAASALATVIMIGALIFIFAYSKLLGTQSIEEFI